MTPQEAIGLLALVRATWPGMSVVEGMDRTWAALFSDVPAGAATEAVLRLGRRTSRFLAVADIRREVARMAGLLAPDEDLAWRGATAVAVDGGLGRNQLHPVVAAVYTDMGGASGPLALGGTTVRAQFRDAYRQARDRHDADVLDAGLDRRLAGKHPAIPALPVSKQNHRPTPDRAADLLRSIP